MATIPGAISQNAERSVPKFRLLCVEEILQRHITCRLVQRSEGGETVGLQGGMFPCQFSELLSCNRFAEIGQTLGRGEPDQRILALQSGLQCWNARHPQCFQTKRCHQRRFRFHELPFQALAVGPIFFG